MTKFFAGHRGYSTVHPENTMSAFQGAVEQGLTGIELDVVLSSDGVPFVMHDDTVDRTTDGSGYCYELTWEMVSDMTVDIGLGNERVPAFEQVLDYFQDSPVFIIVEIKVNDHYVGLASKVADLIVQKNMQHQCQVITHDLGYLDTVKSVDPRIKTGILGISDPTYAIDYAIAKGHKFLSWSIADLSRERVDAIHMAGLEVNTWTANTLVGIQRMIDLGVESISGDNAALLSSAAASNGIVQSIPNRFW